MPHYKAATVIRQVDPDVIHKLARSVELDASSPLTAQLVSGLVTDLDAAGFSRSKSNLETLLEVASSVAPTVRRMEEPDGKSYIGAPTGVDFTLLETIVWLLMSGYLQRMGEIIAEKSADAITMARAQARDLMKRRGYQRETDIDLVAKVMLALGRNTKMSAMLTLKISKMTKKKSVR